MHASPSRKLWNFASGTILAICITKKNCGPFTERENLCRKVTLAFVSRLPLFSSYHSWAMSESSSSKSAILARKQVGLALRLWLQKGYNYDIVWGWGSLSQFLFSATETQKSRPTPEWWRASSFFSRKTWNTVLAASSLTIKIPFKGKEMKLSLR